MAEKTLKPNYYEVMDQLVADFKCTICLEVYVDATWTSCYHLFCRFCISKWLEFTSKCPQCHAPVSKCTPMKAIDDQVDSLFQTLPSGIRKDRNDVKERRRILEAEGAGSIEHTNELLSKLRTQRESQSQNLTLINDEKWFEKITPHIQEENKLQLPRLVPPQSALGGSGGSPESKMNGDAIMAMFENDKDGNQTENKSKPKPNTSQYENLKLPPIRSTSRVGGRQARGITTTTGCQNAEDKFPLNMEGDISKESAQQENIRELERRNKYLENQLFGTYDRIMESIKENDENLAKNVSPNVFSSNKQLRMKTNPTNPNSIKGGAGGPAPPLGVSSQDSNFSKESMMDHSGVAADENENELQPANDIDDLLAETEDLIEIEDFLKKFPFERIRDDDELMDYNVDLDEGADEDIEGLENLGFDQEQLDQIAAHRAQRAKKPLTKEQEAIENFYRKLELKLQKQDGTHGLAVSVRVPKSVTQETSSSKLKRIPNLNKTAGPAVVRIPSNQSLDPIPTPLNRSASKSSIASKTKMTSSVNSNNSNGNKLTTNPNNSANSVLKTIEANKAKVTALDKLGLQSSSSKTKIKKSNSNMANNISNGNSHSRPNAGSNNAPKAPSDSLASTPLSDLNYKDFLKLEIDFLDGDGDWKEFDKPSNNKAPSDHPTRSCTAKHGERIKVIKVDKNTPKINRLAASASSNKLISSGSGVRTVGSNNKIMKGVIPEKPKKSNPVVTGKNAAVNANNVNASTAAARQTNKVEKSTSRVRNK